MKESDVRKVAFAFDPSGEARLVVKVSPHVNGDRTAWGPPMIVIERPEFIDDVHYTAYLEPNPDRGNAFTPHLSVKRARKLLRREDLTVLSPEQVSAGVDLIMEKLSSRLVNALAPKRLTELDEENWLVAAVQPRVLRRWIRRSTPKRREYSANLDTAFAVVFHAMRNAISPHALRIALGSVSPCVLFRFDGDRLETGTLFQFPGCDKLASDDEYAKFATSDGYGFTRDFDQVIGTGIREVIPDDVTDAIHSRVNQLLAGCRRRDGCDPGDDDDTESRDVKRSLMVLFSHFIPLIASLALEKELGDSNFANAMPKLLV